jgi:hypothetical protein
MSHTSKQFGDALLDQRWQRLRFVTSHIGVPDGLSYNYAARACGLLGYSAAQALRWWFHAQADAETFGGLGLETRIIKHHVEYSYKEIAESAHVLIGNHCSGIMPE